MNKRQTERSGVARCQKCFKYGHLTYQCKNQSAYRYRPSRTMQYKQKLIMQLKPTTKPPKSNTLNPDYKRRILEDGPSSDSEDENNNNLVKQTQSKKEIELQSQGRQQEEVENEVIVNKDEDSDSSSSDDSSSSCSSSSNSSSQQQEFQGRKKLE